MNSRQRLLYEVSMINFSELVEKRRSIRKFAQRPVARDDLRQIVEAARLAPSGSNRQPWRFAVLTEERDRESIAPAVVQPFVLEAPLIFVCCLDRAAYLKKTMELRMQELAQARVLSKEAAAALYRRSPPEDIEEVKLSPAAYIDLGIAVEHMILQAAALGLGSCWVRLLDPHLLHRILKLPSRIEVVALLPVGYPAENPPPRPRLSTDEIILHWGDKG
ncbi:MAG: nitroreductase [Firmicutes bacterium]|nr:nitroreductase [Bacillota bacterium]